MAEPVVAAPAATVPAPAAPAPAAPVAAPPAAAAAPAAPGNVIAEAKAEPAAPPTADAMRAFLTEKGGKADELAALDEAALKAKYDEAQKPAAKEDKPGEVKPEDFVVKIPEGIKVDEAVLADFQKTLADAKLSAPERAQALFDLYQGQLTRAAEASTKLWMDTQTDWAGKWKADAEIGGANLNTVTSTIAKALDSIGGPEAAKAREAFIFTGAGNHPEIGRLMYRMSKALVEGGFITGDAPANAKSGDAANERTLMDLYPTANKAR